MCKRPRCKRQKDLNAFQLCPVHCCPVPLCGESKSNLAPLRDLHTTMGSAKVPKGFNKGTSANGVTLYFNTKSQVAQYGHPGQKLENALPRKSPTPIVKAKKGIPVLYVIEPQPTEIAEGWEATVTIESEGKGKGPSILGPVFLFRNIADGTVQQADPTPVKESEDVLPDGWTKEFDEDGDVIYYDHTTDRATYDDPRVVVSPVFLRRLPKTLSSSSAGSRLSQPAKRNNNSAKGKKGKAINISARDVDAFNKLSDNLTKPEGIPKEVRSKKYNRYMDILPNPRTAVKLPESHGDVASTYINANYVRGYVEGDDKRYVAAMGPLPTTVSHFWRMLWQEDAAAVVMVTGLVERGKRKCERYWPAADDGTSMNFGGISVTTSQIVQGQGYTFHMLRVQKGDKVRKIGHFWYTAWPDHGVPKASDRSLYPDDILAMLRTVRKFTKNMKDRPTVVHCSAGIGRTGTIIAINNAINAIEAKAGGIDCVDLIRSVRNDRCALVQHPQQYEFVHEAVLKYLTDKRIPFILEGAGLDSLEEEEEETVTEEVAVVRRKEQKDFAAERMRRASMMPRKALMTHAQMAGELRRTKGGDALHALEEAWQILDIDGDGRITKHEARIQGITEEVFRKMDDNGDGFITLDEFKKFHSAS